MAFTYQIIHKFKINNCLIILNNFNRKIKFKFDIMILKLIKNFTIYLTLSHFVCIHIIISSKDYIYVFTNTSIDFKIYNMHTI